jgi:hypothetical protein
MKAVKWALMGFFGVILAVIVFVKAGAGGGQSGGAQTSQIIKTTGSSLATLATSLEGGG